MTIFTIFSDLERHVEECPNKAFLIDADVTLTYSEFAGFLEKTVQFLYSLQLKPGARIGVHMRKSVTQALIMMAIMRSGYVYVSIPDQHKSKQCEYILDHSECSFLFVDKNLIANTKNFKGNTKKIRSGRFHKQVNDILPLHEHGGLKKIFSHQTAAIIYSSGSTGFPKGITLTHENFYKGAVVVSDYLDIQEDDRIAQLLSMNFDYGINQIMCTIHRACSLFFHNFSFPSELFNFIYVNKISVLPVMPIFLSRIFDPLMFSSSMVEKITSLRVVCTSGGRVPDRITHEITQYFPNTNFFLMYGLTEAFRSTFLDPKRVSEKPASIGKAIPNVEIFILDSEGNECTPGEIGELVHVGGVTSGGYWKDPTATAKKFRNFSLSDGRLLNGVFSGDLVKADADGDMYFVGRLDNMIKTKGHRVSPEEVESIAECIEGVKFGICFGLPNETYGEEIRLICVLEESAKLTEHDIRKYLAINLSSYMQPNFIGLTEEFHVTAGNQGKIDRQEIIKRFS